LNGGRKYNTAMGGAIHSLDERRGTDRRRRRFSVVMHERRCGFDRRVAASPSIHGAVDRFLLAFRSRPGLVVLALFVVNALNLADYLLTLHCLASGGVEANPLMAALFDVGSFYAGLFKLVAVFVATYAVWHFRRHRASLEAAVLMTAVFSVLLVYHVLGLTVLA
jgi:hypothetical protein